MFFVATGGLTICGSKELFALQREYVNTIAEPVLSGIAAVEEKGRGVLVNFSRMGSSKIVLPGFYSHRNALEDKFVESVSAASTFWSANSSRVQDLIRRSEGQKLAIHDTWFNSAVLPKLLLVFDSLCVADPSVALPYSIMNGPIRRQDIARWLSHVYRCKKVLDAVDQDNDHLLLIVYPKPEPSSEFGLPTERFGIALFSEMFELDYPASIDELNWTISCLSTEDLQKPIMLPKSRCSD